MHPHNPTLIAFLIKKRYVASLWHLSGFILNWIIAAATYSTSSYFALSCHLVTKQWNWDSTAWWHMLYRNKLHCKGLAPLNFNSTQCPIPLRKRALIVKKFNYGSWRKKIESDGLSTVALKLCFRVGVFQETIRTPCKPPFRDRI